MSSPQTPQFDEAGIIRSAAALLRGRGCRRRRLWLLGSLWLSRRLWLLG